MANKKNEKVYKIVSENLKQLLKKNNETKSELARAIGVSPSTVSYWLNATSIPSGKMLQKLIDHFHVNLSDIIGKQESGIPDLKNITALSFEGTPLSEEDLKATLNYVANRLKEKRKKEERFNSIIDTLHSDKDSLSDEDLTKIQRLLNK